jgi:hypothetical protein
LFAKAGRKTAGACLPLPSQRPPLPKRHLKLRGQIAQDKRVLHAALLNFTRRTGEARKLLRQFPLWWLLDKKQFPPLKASFRLSLVLKLLGSFPDPLSLSNLSAPA